MSHHELTTKDKEFLYTLMHWQRKRYINYATKKNMTYNQALNFLFRRPFEAQIKELDSIVDSEYHSSNEPKQQAALN